MYKRLVPLCLMFICHTIYAQQAVKTSTLKSSDIVGKWYITLGYHITNGEKSEGSAPLIASYWQFNADGSYEINASVIDKGKYEVNNGVLILYPYDKNSFIYFINRQTITYFDTKKMDLCNSISDTKDFKMDSCSSFEKK